MSELADEAELLKTRSSGEAELEEVALINFWAAFMLFSLLLSLAAWLSLDWKYDCELLDCEGLVDLFQPAEKVMAWLLNLPVIDWLEFNRAVIDGDLFSVWSK